MTSGIISYQHSCLTFADKVFMVNSDKFWSECKKFFVVNTAASPGIGAIGSVGEIWNPCWSATSARQVHRPFLRIEINVRGPKRTNRGD